MWTLPERRGRRAQHMRAVSYVSRHFAKEIVKISLRYLVDYIINVPNFKKN